jgi:chromosome segregation ATPase
MGDAYEAMEANKRPSKEDRLISEISALQTENKSIREDIKEHLRTIDCLRIKLYNSGCQVTPLKAEIEQLNETNTKLRGHLQNCANHLDRIKRRYPADENKLNSAIEMANKALNETLFG